jgi:hypothetical protein
MNYLWPLPHPDPVLDDALDIALAYLEATGQAKAGDDTQHLVATAVLAAWLEGRRHKIRLANLGIVSVQQVRCHHQAEQRTCVWTLRDLAVP